MMRFLGWVARSAVVAAALGGQSALAEPKVPVPTFHSAGAGQMALPVSSLTSLKAPHGATVAQICVEAGDVRYRDDGIAPTPASGVPIEARSCTTYFGQLDEIQFIAKSGSPTINVLYYIAN